MPPPLVIHFEPMLPNHCCGTGKCEQPCHFGQPLHGILSLREDNYIIPAPQLYYLVCTEVLGSPSRFGTRPRSNAARKSILQLLQRSSLRLHYVAKYWSRVHGKDKATKANLHPHSTRRRPEELGLTRYLFAAASLHTKVLCMHSRTA